MESNVQPFPSEINESAIILSPFFSDEEKLNELNETLRADGWNIETTNLLVIGNHWFKKDSLGLFLLPVGDQPSDRLAEQDIANIYRSRDCDSEIKLQLNNGGSYEFVFIDDNQSQYVFLTGSWIYESYPYIELVSFDEQQSFYFQIEQFAEVDKLGEVEIIQLKPLNTYQEISNCSFVYGQRSL